MMSMFTWSVLFFTMFPLGKSGCTPSSLDGGTYGLKLTGNATNDNGNLNTGDTYAVVTVKCLSTGFAFTNGVKRVPELNVTNIATEHSIEVQCGEDDSWSPNIWYKYSATGVADSDVRHTYCSPGCYMLPISNYDVTYPDGLITTEQYSAPIQSNSELYVSLQCPDGYAEAVGDTGYSTLQCTGGDDGIDVEWSVDENNRLTCVRGCTDITESVQYGETTASASTIADGPPFTAGDVIPFSCKNGYTLIGHSILTCTGANTWNEDLPECVQQINKSNGLIYSILLVVASLLYVQYIGPVKH